MMFKVLSEKSQDRILVRVKVPSSGKQPTIAPSDSRPKNYMTLHSVAKSLGLEAATLLKLLDCLRIILDKNSPLSEKFGGEIDIGLNLINRQSLMIVPELVICQKLEEGWQPNRGYFESIEFAEEAVDLIKRYAAKFPFLVKKLNESPNRFQYLSKDFVDHSRPQEDPNLQIISVYGWLLKQKTSSLIQVPINSKVLYKS